MNTKSILEMTNNEAKQFFFEMESYSRIDLPSYLKLDNLFNDVIVELKNKKLKDIKLKNVDPTDFDDVNYKLLTNKDGKYAWREFQLINPLLYVTLVNEITEKKNWQFIVNRFKDFSKNDHIVPMSLPVYSDEIDVKKASILTWWEEVEQKSITLSLEYSVLLQTDVTNCYPSINTHHIPLALYGQEFMNSKKNRLNNKFIGNKIDCYLRAMQMGENIGIPQGTMITDFFAEMIFGYIDMLLSDEIKKSKISKNEYFILRYRDDYKIFAKESNIAENILRILNAILEKFGLKLNSQKTKASENVIEDSIKPDKFCLLGKDFVSKNIENDLLGIYKFSLQYPNAGQLVRLLESFFNSLDTRKKVSQVYVEPLISIVVDIAYRNPRVYPACCGIISKILSKYKTKRDKKDIVLKIKEKLSKLSNDKYWAVWLQRVSLLIDKKIDYDQEFCKIVNNQNIKLWNDSWVKGKYKNLLNTKKIVIRKELENVRPVMTNREFRIFVLHSRY